MADIKINGNTYTGVTKLLAKKSDGNGEQAFVIPELESRTVNLGSSAPASVPWQAVRPIWTLWWRWGPPPLSAGACGPCSA